MLCYIIFLRQEGSYTTNLHNTLATIQNELLKSAELTGQWEKRLREIEAHQYNAHQFIYELKQMVCELVQQVKMTPRAAAPQTPQTPQTPPAQ